MKNIDSRWRKHQERGRVQDGGLRKFQLSEGDKWMRAGGADEDSSASDEQNNENYA
ncbi:hypothetical protein [Herbaspirillum rubrisubalbicans]|uniref:hypothetical protein n=1 Tax=Herbaspirillum rubrisubalbicans TaxID=80842 RepID=UPI0020A65CB9|nr:hypothetical protein [Herbaspirillum rubrisubalbicans]